MLELVAVVPGEPCAQGRGRAFYRPGLGVRVFDPKRSVSWKGTAQVHYQHALKLASVTAPAFAAGVAVELHVFAVFGCPKSHHRKRAPLPRRPKVATPDSDNLGKACMDAGNGLLWEDDCQVVRLVVEKLIGAQGEAPFVQVTVREILLP